jgi:hypothetical protein
MKQIAVVSYQEDVDVSKGMAELIAKYPKAKVLIPVERYNIFAKSVLQVVLANDMKFHLFISDESEGIDDAVIKAEDITFCSNPNREVMRQVRPYDVLALVWDDSTDAHIALHTLEDFGLESWDISDGLDMIEIDHADETAEELMDAVQDSMAAFIENLSAYVVTTVLDALTQSVNEHIDSIEHQKDISPFDDEE